MRVPFFGLVLLVFQGFIYYSFLKYLKSTRNYAPYYRYLAALPFLLFNVPFILISVFWGSNFDPPSWFRATGIAAFYVWISASIFIFAWLLAGMLIKLPFQIPIWLLKIFRPTREKLKHVKETKAVQKIDYSRRQFVKYATFAASTYAFAGATYGLIAHDEYEIDYKEIRIDNLPEELKGLTVTLLSDIHAGIYMNEDDMRKYADAANELHSDIICIPGDFVNFARDDAKPVARAFRDLHAKYGIYGSLGNHDFFQDPDYVAQVINNESPIQVLRNEHRKLKIKGKEMYIIGVDDTRSSGTGSNGVVLGYADEVDTSLKKSEPAYDSAPKIMLCHKPYGFDDLAKREFDLVLSGHTHGGQVVPFKYGEVNISFAGFVSKYIEGHYKIGKSNMYVSRGIGTVAIPIRLNCPPEITKITLV